MIQHRNPRLITGTTFKPQTRVNFSPDTFFSWGKISQKKESLRVHARLKLKIFNVQMH